MKRLSWIRNLLIVVLLIATVVHVNPIAALVNAVGEPQVGHARLIDFEGEYELPDDDSPVSVLVLFEHEPATVQVVEAEAAGAWLLEAEAVQNVEDDHERFRAELSRLFGREGDLLPEHTPPYDIVWEYRIGLNGVNLVLPANKVAELASFESVQLVIPNVTLTVELPVMEPTIDAVVEPALDVVEAPLSGNPWGMRPGRTAMGADVLHAAGYRGAGVVIAVLDTGVYRYHPAFEGAFLTYEQMRARGVNMTQDETIDGIFYGRNFFEGGFNRPANDPMELIVPPPLDSTDHGTHVAGTLVARETAGNQAALGVAPEASLFVYRILQSGPGGGQVQLGDLLASFEQAVHDRADVVNMSFGMSGWSMAINPISVAINNIMLYNPYIVFVVSAGNIPNSQPVRSLQTLTSPGPGSRYLTVANAGLGVNVNAQTFQTDPIFWTLAERSARGPVGESFEIKPDIAAHGTHVFSTHPSWNDYFAFDSGTSMATPHVAGAAALLIDYSRQNGTQWTAEEIKTRLMNQAMPFGSGIGVFETGAGFVNVAAAAASDTVVHVYYDRVAHQIDLDAQSGVTFTDQHFLTTRLGSFSFGSVGQLAHVGLNPYHRSHQHVRTLNATIENRHHQPQTYTISYRFTYNPSQAAMLTLSQRTMTLEENEVADFSASISVGGHVPGGIARGAFFEGHLYVRNEQDHLVARLPFALVNEVTRTVEASALHVYLGGDEAYPTFPGSIDSIHVNHGGNVMHFLSNYHRGFTSAFGGFPTENLVPERAGHRFLGWYLDAHFEVALSETTVMPPVATTLYARWEAEVAATPRELLNGVLAEVGQHSQANYTPLSWARMQSMLMMASMIYNNPTSTEAQLSEAIVLLTNARQALVLR